MPIGKARIVREGTELTIIGIGYTTHLCVQVAEELASNGISAEVIDLLSLSPLDEDTILSSVKKTRRVIMALYGRNWGEVPFFFGP